MCGIAGRLSLERLNDDVVTQVCASLAHRGPDGSAAAALEGATLVHTRLAILDLSDAGAQPVRSSVGNVWAVVNGEIYNHRALRTRLRDAGYSFRGHCDAEVVPALYHHLGPGFLDELRGMYAIAVYDEDRKRLLLARDRFGIKPLFVAENEKAVSFASEINALRLMPDINTHVDEQAIYDFLHLLYIPAPATAFRGVRAIEPGEYIEAALDRRGLVSTSRRMYNQWSIVPDHELTLEAATERADELLSQAVGRQLEADVPLGALLSGGIDSSLVAASAQRATDSPLRTFNVQFSGSDYDETPAALAVAEHLHTRHETLRLDQVSLTWDDVVRTFGAVGQPFADTLILAATPICRSMRSHVKVGLSGDGGDEGFGGYEAFDQIRRLAQLSWLPARMRKIGLAAAASAAAPLSTRAMLPQSLPHRLRSTGTAPDLVAMLASLYSWIQPDELGQIWTGTEMQPTSRLFGPRWHHGFTPNATRLERMSALTTEVTTRLSLAGDYLPKTDVASMSNGLEIRVPLLDEDLFAFGLTLPHALKSGPSQRKRVLRSLGRRWLPATVTELPKHGFGVPVGRSASIEFKESAFDMLTGTNVGLLDMVDSSYTRQVVTAFRDGTSLAGVSQQGLELRVFMLLSLCLTTT